MAFYAEEEAVWRCPKHPSKHRRSGICPICLRDRLITLCPDCANLRPCPCCTSATSSSSSSSSSFSLFSHSGGGHADASRSSRVGEVGRLSNLIDCEPAFRRSRSVAIPFLRSRYSAYRDSGDSDPSPPVSGRKSSFWSVFRTHKGEKSKGGRENEDSKRIEFEVEDDYSRQMMMRSRSMAAPVASDPGARKRRSSSAKSRSWYFPSPMNVFRHSKTSKVVQQRSPLFRG